LASVTKYVQRQLAYRCSKRRSNFV